MSMNRMCPMCESVEDIRINFGDNVEAENAFHKEDWCGCGFKSKEEYLESINIYVTNEKFERYENLLHIHNNYLHELLNEEARKNKDTFAEFNNHHVKHTIYGDLHNQVRHLLWEERSNHVWELFMKDLIPDKKRMKWNKMPKNKKKWLMYENLIK